MRILNVTWSHLRVCAANELQYRVNFFVQALQSLVALAVGLVSLGLVFSYTKELGGWSQADLLIVMGIYMAMGGILSTFIQPNMGRLLWEIAGGDLDFALTKPVDSQVMVSTRQLRFWSLTDVAVGLVVIGVGITTAGTGLGAWQAIAFASMLSLGAVLLYSFWLMVTCIAFWVTRIQDFFLVFEAIYAAGRWPVDIYPAWLRIGLTFLVPVAFAVSVPAEALTGRLTPRALMAAAAMAALFFGLARLIWNRAVLHYSGASA